MTKVCADNKLGSKAEKEKEKEKATILVSIIIPTLNESTSIQEKLQRLQSLRMHGFECIVADGGSTDGTQCLVTPLVDQFVQSQKGRSQQMNSAAVCAKGQWLLFLHADTELPDNIQVWKEFISNNELLWGYFRIRLSGRSFMFRVVEKAVNCRSFLTKVATGDQCIFVQKNVFDSIGLYPDIPLMEDVALSKSLRALGKPIFWRSAVTTSSRRWEEKGILRTILLMWFLRLAYFAGVSPLRLHRFYYGR
jgi:rSAM/selenodomain-associated transferase 2